MSYQPHEQRVVDEFAELNSKIEKLREFILHSPIYFKMPETDQELLNRQYAVMDAYSRILHERIQRF